MATYQLFITFGILVACNLLFFFSWLASKEFLKDAERSVARPQAMELNYKM